MLNDPLSWAVILLIVGFGLMFLEMFIPSGGILGVLSVIAILASMIMAFRHPDSRIGVGFVIGEMIGLSVAVALMLRWWPHTSLGRRVLPNLPTSDEVMPDNDEIVALKLLVGKVGRAKCVMLPSGAVSIEGRTVNAVSEGMAIEAGQLVRVIQVRGNRVVVRPADDSTDEPKQGRKSSPDDDILSQPLDRLGLDQLDEPLA